MGKRGNVGGGDLTCRLDPDLNVNPGTGTIKIKSKIMIMIKIRIMPIAHPLAIDLFRRFCYLSAT